MVGRLVVVAVHPAGFLNGPRGCIDLPRRLHHLLIQGGKEASIHKCVFETKSDTGRWHHQRQVPIASPSDEGHRHCRPCATRTQKIPGAARP